MASAVSDERTPRRSSVRSGFVYGLSDGNWFGFVLNSPTEWSTPDMHFPDVAPREEFDPLATLDDFSRTVAAVVDETESPTQTQTNTPRSRFTEQQQQRRAQTADRRRVPTLPPSFSSNSPVIPRHSIPSEVAGSTAKK